MSNSHAESSRPARTLLTLAIAARALIAPNPLSAQCTPATIQINDVQVASGSAENATIGMATLNSAGAIIVAYDLFSADTEIMARRFSATGAPSGPAFPLTAHNANPDLNPSPCVEIKLDPSLAVSSNDLVAVAFITQFGPDCHYRNNACQFDSDCQLLNCDLSCAYYGTSCAVDLQHGGYACFYHPGGLRAYSTLFAFTATPTPFPTRVVPADSRNDSAPSAAIDNSGSPILAWRNNGDMGACSNAAPFGWLIGSNSGGGSILLGCSANCATSGLLYHRIRASLPRKSSVFDKKVSQILKLLLTVCPVRRMI